MDWRTVEETSGTRLERASVDGGWLYRATVFGTSWNRVTQTDDECVLSQSIAFVPDAR
jgi:hypothetical protein